MSDSVARLAQFLTQPAWSMLVSLLPRREMWVGFPVGKEDVARPGLGGKNHPGRCGVWNVCETFGRQ